MENNLLTNSLLSWKLDFMSEIFSRQFLNLCETALKSYQLDTPTLIEAKRTIYSPDFVLKSSSNIKIAVNIPEIEEVTFTLVSNKKHKEKNKASSLSSMSSSNSRSKTLLISQALSLSKVNITQQALRFSPALSHKDFLYLL